jgi:hypothetical protein
VLGSTILAFRARAAMTRAAGREPGPVWRRLLIGLAVACVLLLVVNLVDQIIR